MTRVAIIECDLSKVYEHRGVCYFSEMVREWLTSGSDFANMKFEIFFANAADSSLIMLPNVDAFDAFIIPGSHSNVSEDLLWMKDLGNFIRHAYQLRKKIFGICFGHQIIAHALGGYEQPCPPFNFGIDQVQFDLSRSNKNTRSWFRNNSRADDVFAVTSFKSHGCQVLRIPSFCTVLASSLRTPVESFSDGECILTCQFHPEFDRRVMIEIRPSTIGASSLFAGEGQKEAANVVEKHNNDFANVALRFLRGGNSPSRPSEIRGHRIGLCVLGVLATLGITFLLIRRNR